jgi:hypothetical protein
VLISGVSNPAAAGGHSSLNSTMVYLHLTTQGHEHAYDIINSLMRGDDHENE